MLFCWSSCFWVYFSPVISGIFGSVSSYIVFLNCMKPNWLPWLVSGKESACQCRRRGFDPWIKKIPLEKKMATHSSILAKDISWRKEPGGLQSIGSERVRHDWATKQHQSQSTVVQWQPSLISKKLFCSCKFSVSVSMDKKECNYTQSHV